MTRRVPSRAGVILAVVLGMAAMLAPTSGPAPVPGVALASGVAVPAAAQAAAVAAGGLVESTVGQLIDDDLGCTATMVASPSGRVAVTAAHCVYVPQRHDHLGASYAGLRPGWRTGMVFVPGRAGDQAPQGVWEVAHGWIDRQWRDHAELAFDVAFIELADRDGRTAQQVLGAQGIAFAAVEGATGTATGMAAGTAAGTAAPLGEVPLGEVTVFGYPAAPPFDGTEMRSCSAPTTVVADTPPVAIVGMECPMTGGSSGGPWLVGLDDEAAGAGTVGAVTSFTPLDQPGRLAGQVLGPAAQQLWQTAGAAGGRGGRGA
jgi:V8-like Glu-specific endopeptidase